MGLCKCPRKKVTNQFCFEHKVNVCEYCMVDGPHKTCIVGPYLNWLENSNYDPSCQLCKTELHHAECARLGCYHIFHLECLNNYGRQYPPNTAPAGYTCPLCSSPIFSLSSSKSPVFAHLEKLLSSFPWAQEAIGLTGNQSFEMKNGDSANYSSLLDDSTRINMPMSTGGTSSSEANNFSSPKIIHNSLSNKLNNSNYSAAPVNVISNVTSYISTNSDLSFGSTSSMRSKFDNESRRPLLASVDEVAEDKYRTKSPIEFISRWLRSRSTYMRNQATMSNMTIYKRLIIYGFLAFLFLFILVHYFIKYGRQAAESDPFLDPENDPNLRHGDN